MLVCFVLLDACVSIFVIAFQQVSLELVGAAFVELAIGPYENLWRSHISQRGVHLRSLALILPSAISDPLTSCSSHATGSDLSDRNAILEEVVDHTVQLFVGQEQL